MYGDESDYERIRALLVEILRLQGPPVDCTVGDLDWWRFAWGASPSDIETARLWEDPRRRLLAVAWFGYALVDQFVHPAHRDLEDEMLAWAESERAGEKRAAEGDHTLTAFAFERDPIRPAILARRGYVCTDRYGLRFGRPLTGAIASPGLPPGYRVRTLRNDEDVERRVAVHRAAFAHTKVTLEEYRALQDAPSYRLDQDFVVESPDGSFAAFALVWLDEANQTMLFEPVGCHPDHRRRGLTRALLVEACRRMQARGARYALVGTSHVNEAAAGLYRSAGFVHLDRFHEWRLAL
jgi:ribosomal protein S18 acetylase RimI-like enzyme